MVACLLLDVAPEAELYIAKVTEGEKIPKTKLYQIADVRGAFIPTPTRLDPCFVPSLSALKH